MPKTIVSPKKSIFNSISLTLVLLLSLCFIKADAQTAGDYQTRNSGSWSDPNTWSIYVGAPTNAWINATGTPTFADGVITILSPHVVNVVPGQPITIDQTIVAAGGTLNILGNVTLQSDATPTAELQVDGTLTSAGNSNLIINTGATITGATTTFSLQGNITNVGNLSQLISLDGTTTQTLSGTGNYQKLKINNPAGISLGTGTVAVSGTLDFVQGKITTGSQIFYIQPATVITGAGAGRYVYGNVQRGSPAGTNITMVFPIGDANNYLPATILFTSIASPGGTVIGSTVAGELSNIATSKIDAAHSVNRSWNFSTSAGIVFGSASVSVNTLPGDFDNVSELNQMIAGEYSLSSGTWTYPAITARSTTGFTIDPVTNLSGISFAIGNEKLLNVPDVNFRNALFANGIDQNGDAVIQLAEATAFTGMLSINDDNISDLTGLEAFVNLTGLTAYRNPYTVINLATNTKLTYLFISETGITTLDVSMLPQLQTLLVGQTALTTLDLSNNPQLTFFNSPQTQIGSLSFVNKAMTYINVSGSGNLTSLDITGVNVTNLTYFNATSNAQLFCIKTDNVTGMQTKFGVATSKDPQATFSATCPLCSINIPDANFKAALLANPLINTNGNGEIECGEAASYTGAIDVSSRNISDLTGIEAFASISSLACDFNNLTSLDIRQDTNLVSINCVNNAITNFQFKPSVKFVSFLIGNNQIAGALDLSTCTNINDLNVANNHLTSLVLPASTPSIKVQAQGNSLTALNTASTIGLQMLIVSGNQITSLDLSHNPGLTQLFANDNKLTSLNAKKGNTTGYIDFNVTNNPQLTCIQVDDVSYMNTTWSAGKDAGANYNTDCSATPAAALNLSGNGEYISIPHFVRPDEMTIDLWIKKPNDTEGHLLDWTNSGNANIYAQLFIQQTSGRIFYQENDGSTIEDIIAPVNMGDNQWHHITVTRTNELTNNAKIYVDGVLSITGTVRRFINTDQLRIGYSAFATLNATIDEFRVWSRALCAEEILARQNCETAANESLLKFAYHFNQGNAGLDNTGITTVTDGSEAGLNATLVGFTRTGATSNFIAPGAVVTGTTCAVSTLKTLFKDADGDGFGDATAPRVFGVICTVPGWVVDATDCNDADPTQHNNCALIGSPGAALNFDGVDDVVKVVNSGVDLSNKSFSVEMWMKRRSTNTFDVAFSQGDNGGTPAPNTALHIGFNPGGQFLFNFYNNDLAFNVTQDPGWHHWAATFDNTTKKRIVYRDGVIVGQDVATSSFLGWQGNTTLFIGDASYGNNNFDGSIDEMRIWTKALTQAEVVAGMNCEVFAPKTNLAAAYHFNQGLNNTDNYTQTYTTDASGNNHDGVLTGFALLGPSSNWVAPGGVVIGNVCCGISIKGATGDTLVVCADGGITTTNVNFVVTGNNGAYTISGDDSTSVGAGIYNYSVSDASGCTATTTVRVIFTNCIIPYYQPPTNDTTRSLIGTELTQLFKFPESVIDTARVNDIFVTKPGATVNDSKQVLIDVIVNMGNYQSVLNTLITNYGFNGQIDNGPNSLIITGFVPINFLDDINMMTQQVNYVRPTFPPIASAVSATGLTVTQGDKAMYADKARQAWKVSGKGIKIGVMSDSYNKVNNKAVDDVANGDLPGKPGSAYPLPVNVRQDYPYTGGTDEGRAMLQIVHDVAPDAELYFRTGFISPGNFAAGIKDLRDQGCKVIVDDITYLTEPYFSDGIVSKAVDDVTASGVSYFTSAGNFGVKSYEGDFAPIAPPGSQGFTANAKAHDFGGNNYFQDIDLPIGTYTLALQWDDDFYSDNAGTGAMNDLDFYLFDGLGVKRLFGFNRDNMQGDPLEIMPFEVTLPTKAKLLIVRSSGTRNVHFKYILFRGDGVISNTSNLTGTVVGQANAANAISVGAIRYDFTPAFGGVNPSVATFSSRGGVKVNGVDRNKPDIVAPNGVNTTVNFGVAFDDGDVAPNIFPNFFGTSAAAPHAAAVAALILEAKKNIITILRLM